MPEHSANSDPSLSSDSIDSPVLDQEEFDVEEEEEEEEVEEEEIEEEEEEEEEEEIEVEEQSEENEEEEKDSGDISTQPTISTPEITKGISNGSSALVSEQITSEENGILETLSGETFKGIQLLKEITNESPKHLKSNCLETQGSHHSLGSVNARSVKPRITDLSVEGGIRNESEIINQNITEKGVSHLQEKTHSQMLEDSTLTCGHTPQKRLRSSSPVSDPDKMNKRLADICVFYARGWCIKGNSCKFLHHKDGVDKIEQQNNEDRAGVNLAGDSMATTGSDEISDRSKVSSAPLESNPKGSSGCNSLLQRELVRTYGTGSHAISQVDDQYDIHTKGEFGQSDFQAGYASTKEEYKKPFGKMNDFESIVERLPDASSLSKRHLIEGKLINEINMDSPYSGRSHQVDAFISDYKHYSGSSSLSSILHQNSGSPSAYGRAEGDAISSAQSHFLKQETYNSHSLAGSLNLGLGGSFQLPQMDYKISQAGTSLTSSSARNTEYLEGPSLQDLDRRYHGSGSISFTRDPFPYHSRPELQNMLHHNIPGDMTSRHTTKIQYDAWEPSQPFRSSLAIATKSLSSPSQYDPILDSIEPAIANARDCFQTSQMTPFQNASFLSTKTENAVSWEGMLAKKVSLSDSSAHAAADVFLTSINLKGGSCSFHDHEKAWNPDRLVESSNNKDSELGGEWKNIDKSRNIKESKALKIFHTALVDFVKDLLKPWWREGQLSKDGHKTIVKKSVEKVLSTLQSHQIPSTPDAIYQYLATSRPKIVKLVDSYAQKHANA